MCHGEGYIYICALPMSAGEMGATQATCLLQISRAMLVTWLRGMGVQDMGESCPIFITC